jgi:hypothetical protein
MQATIIIPDKTIERAIRAARLRERNASMTPQMTPPIAPATKAMLGETPSPVGCDKIKNRIAAAESSVNKAGVNRAHKNNRQRNFTGGNCRSGSASGNKFFPQNGHHAAE